MYVIKPKQGERRREKEKGKEGIKEKKTWGEKVGLTGVRGKTKERNISRKE